MRGIAGIVVLAGIATALAACGPRGLDAPPLVPASQPAAAPVSPPDQPRARAPAPGARRTAPAEAPADGTDLVAVPPWLDLDDPKDHAWVDGMRRALRAVGPQAAKCREEAAAAVPGCLCKLICAVKFPKLKQREGSMEISYPPLPGGGPSLRGFRLRADGAVDSCTFRGGDSTQPGARTTEIVWCAEEVGGSAAPPKAAEDRGGPKASADQGGSKAAEDQGGPKAAEDRRRPKAGKKRRRR